MEGSVSPEDASRTHRVDLSQTSLTFDPDLDTAVRLLQLSDSEFLPRHAGRGHFSANANSHQLIKRFPGPEIGNAGHHDNRLSFEAGNLAPIVVRVQCHGLDPDNIENNNTVDDDDDHHHDVSENGVGVQKSCDVSRDLLNESNGNTEYPEHRVTVEEPSSGQPSIIGVVPVENFVSSEDGKKSPVGHRQLLRSDSTPRHSRLGDGVTVADRHSGNSWLKPPIVNSSSSGSTTRSLHLEDSGLPSSPCHSGGDYDVADQSIVVGNAPRISCIRYLSDPSPFRESWPSAVVGHRNSCVSEDVQDMSLSTSPSSDEATCGGIHKYPSSRRVSSNVDSDEPQPSPSDRMLPFQPANSFCYGENDDFSPAPEILCPPKCSSYPLQSYLCEPSSSQPPQYYTDAVDNGATHDEEDHDYSQDYKNIGYRDSTETEVERHSDTPPLPQPTSVQCWGHFARPRKHYKYRRSDYSSESEDELAPRSPEPCPSAKTQCVRPQKSHLAVRSLHKSSSLGGAIKVDVVDVDVSDGLDFREGVKPYVFKEKFAAMKRWFTDFNDEQKNIVLKGLLSGCDLPQIHLLSVKMEANLHRGCPPNCQDIITWLPSCLAAKIMSYLDPMSLCRSSQVCHIWQHLADDPSFWRRFCCQPKWRLSKAAEHKQVISHMSVEGSIQWKNVFAERFRLRNNWIKGRCTVRTFEGHTQGISCVQFDDTRIVSGSSDKTVKVWNIRTNAPWSVQTLVGHSGTVRCLHLEGSRLVSGSSDKTIKVWDLSTRDSWSRIVCKVTMTGHTDTVRCLQVDDDKVISGSYDKTLKVWGLKKGNCRMTLRGHQGAVLCVHFNETKIVSGSCDNTIKVWNYRGTCVMTLAGHQDAVTCLQFDATRIVSGSLDYNLKFWDIHSGECVNTIDWKAAEGHTGVVRCLQSDSWRLVSAADDKTIKVWNLETGQRLVTLQNHKDGVTCLQFNDFIIVSGSYDKTVKLWDFSSC